MRSIQDISNKFKSFLEDEAIFTISLILLVAVVSFGLGRRSVGEGMINRVSEAAETAAPAAVSAANTNTVKSQSATTTSSTFYVASKNGTKYHLPWCSGAKRITEANKITFNSKAEAEAAGFQPAANCPGI